MRYQLGKKAGSLGSAVGLVVAAMALPAGAANLLINPGFESPVDNSGNTDTTASGWTFYGGDCERANFNQNHTPGGKWAIWLQTFQQTPNTGSGVYQDVPVPAGGIGTTYNLTSWFYFETGVPAETGEISDLALTFLNAGGSLVGPPVSNGFGTFSDVTNIPSSSVTSGMTNQWLQYNVSGVAPTGATQVEVSFDFTNPTFSGAQSLAILVDDADLEGVGTVPPGQWGINASGDWNVAGNWTTASVPNGVGAEADFLGIITSLQTVYTNTALTEGTLHFNNANEYVIAGAPALTLQTTTGSALVEVDQGTDELDLPVVVASNTVFNVATGATLIVANPVTVDSGKALTQSGGGTVTYQSIITVLGSGSITFANSTHAHELSLASGATASVGGTGTVLTVDSLANSGTLNLENSTLLIDYGSSTDPIASVRAELISGRNAGAWNGTTGINSSTAALPANSAYGLGYADSADPGNPAGLSSGTIEVKYTLLGDATLTGTVTGTDFTILATNLGKSVSGWDQGDFLYTGTVTGSDFTALVTNLGKTSNGGSVVLPASDWAAVDAFAAANGLMADVPEPTSFGLLGLAAAGVLARRRRSA
ncbi:MAG: PEP-CTERM sorting domain-containing protein [Tepidisphaeraceae bacterium]